MIHIMILVIIAIAPVVVLLRIILILILMLFLRLLRLIRLIIVMNLTIIMTLLAHYPFAPPHCLESVAEIIDAVDCLLWISPISLKFSMF